MPRIDAFLKLGTAQGCSDVHLAVGVPPMLRMMGDLMPIRFRNLGDTELEGYVAEILTKTQQEQFRHGHDLDFSYVSEDGGRTWREDLFQKVHPDCHELVATGAPLKPRPAPTREGEPPEPAKKPVSPRLLLGTDGGAYLSADAGDGRRRCGCRE